MFETFECQCLYVEVSNPSHPKSGSFEYRAKLCTVCQARGELALLSGKSATAFDSAAPRYQRTH